MKKNKKSKGQHVVLLVLALYVVLLAALVASFVNVASVRNERKEIKMIAKAILETPDLSSLTCPL